MPKPSLPKIVPHLWYTKEAEEAARFYAAVFPDSHVDRVTSLPADSAIGPAGSLVPAVTPVFDGQPSPRTGGRGFLHRESNVAYGPPPCTSASYVRYRDATRRAGRNGGCVRSRCANRSGAGPFTEHGAGRRVGTPSPTLISTFVIWTRTTL
jgi:3-demethylubiquinone-9 3-methyltransferase